MARIDPRYLRRAVYYPSAETPGTIVVDVQNRFLYSIEGSGRAIRYGIGVGRQGFSWSGIATVRNKQEWPDWYPPREMIERKPELMSQVSTLQSGLGVPGGPTNPLGARALYLWQGNKDTLYRIHGTNEPWTIGTERFLRLHSHAEPGRHRSLRAHAARSQSRGPCFGWSGCDLSVGGACNNRDDRAAAGHPAAAIAHRRRFDGAGTRTAPQRPAGSGSRRLRRSHRTADRLP